MRYLKHERRCISIAGFSVGKAIKARSVFDWMNSQDLVAQVFDAESIAGWEHIFHSVVNATAAFRAEANITRNLSIEILLYVSGQDQIERALHIVGIDNSTRKMCLVVIADSEANAVNFREQFQTQFSLTKDDSVLEISGEEKFRHLKDIFSIEDLAIETIIGKGLTAEEALKGLIIEKGALLVTKR